MHSWIDVDHNGKISLRKLFPHKDTSCVKHYVLEAKEAGKLILRLYDENMHTITDLPSKKLICTKNLIAMTRTATQQCWTNAVKSLGRKYGIKDEQELKAKYRDELDSKYRELVCKLETDVLEAILLCHNKGKFHRAKITLQAISDEITRRALLNDSSRTKRSDSK